MQSFGVPTKFKTSGADRSNPLFGILDLERKAAVNLTVESFIQPLAFQLKMLVACCWSGHLLLNISRLFVVPSNSMAHYNGVQLALELTNVLPIKELVTIAGNKFLDFARSFRKSGSDISVEQDLTLVFGRLRLAPAFEESFRSTCLIQDSGPSEPLYQGSEIHLQAGIGPTVQHALRDQGHFATVVQLSMLAWFQNRTRLSRALNRAMHTRYKSGLRGAPKSPIVQDLENTLAFCSSQTNVFNWTHHSQAIQRRIREQLPAWRYSRECSNLPL